ncbi:MAG: TIGR02186 family protein [Rhodobacter sp.]|nr:TIGR02186 family protein [Rhodobacter sp.]
MIRLFAFLMMIAPAFAQETVVAGLSQTRVSITAQFQGSEILVYGAVKRNAPEPEGPPLQVIITAEGPAMPVMVRSKDRRFGLWVNTSAVQIDQAPSFYAIATTAPLPQILTETEDLRHRISIPRAIRAVGVAAENLDAPSFTEALIRIRAASGAYGMREGAVALSQDTLFRADVALPANLTEGDYRVRIFLTRGGVVIDSLESTINVRKEGLERWLANLARQQPLIYGLMSLLIAVVAGWAASAGFRLLRA